MSLDPPSSPRRFLSQALAWSALAATQPVFAVAPRFRRADAAQALVLGDWGWLDVVGPNDLRGGDGFAAQAQVAQGMRHYVTGQRFKPDALFLLGDSWYGDLPGGAQSPRWKTQFEQMYPAELFPGPAYTMLGNHDYQRLPPSVNKVEAELQYASDLYVLKTDDLKRGPYAQEVHGFSHLSVSKEVLELRHLDSSGRFLFGIRKTLGGTLQILAD